MSRMLPVCLIFLAGNAFAWGPVGHQAICQLAYEELNASARQAVDRLIGLDPQYESFAESCLFADFPERQRPEEHYMNLPRDARAIATLACPLADSCVLTAIGKDVAVLEDPARSDGDKLTALKLLGHWVGDIHQPMHVTFSDDRGANWIPNVGECERNLHATWDSCIIETLLGRDYRVVTADLRAGIDDGDRDGWVTDNEVEWANESYRIAIDRKTGYCISREGACWYTADNFILTPGETQRTMFISKSYLRRHRSTVELRLRQAGVRLGALLNRVFAPPPRIMEDTGR